MTESNSQELFNSFRDGGSHAAGDLFDRYVHRLLALARNRISPKLARRIDPEDVVQSAYRSFFVHARDGDYAVQRAGDLWRLLARITLNKLHRQIERHTAQRRSVNNEEDIDLSERSYEERLFAREPTPDEVVAIAEQLELVMQQATVAERRVLEMRLQGHTIQEIASSLNRSQRTVRRLLEHVRCELENKLRTE